MKAESFMIIGMHLLLTILVIAHWFKGYDIFPTVTFWCLFWGLSISPVLDIIYGFNKDDDTFDDEFQKRVDKVLNDIDEENLRLNYMKAYPEPEGNRYDEIVDEEMELTQIAIDKHKADKAEGLI